MMIITKCPFPPAALALLGVLWLPIVAGCEPRREPPPPPTETVAPEPPPASAWRDADGSQIVAVADDDALLEAAMAEARATADAARRRWQAMDETGRDRWAVKWAAPTLDGGREFLWVRPVTWSAFRIEGRLASPPQQELENGRGLDDLVSFPGEELADWLEDGPEREGGFTLRVLDERFGAP